MTLQEGDPVTFQVGDDTLVTHRIIEIVPDSKDADNQYFRTKGDANEMEDGVLIACDQVVGKPMFTIPQLGYLAAYIQQPPGMYIAISVAAGLMLFVMLADSLTEEKTAYFQHFFDRSKTGSLSKFISERLSVLLCYNSCQKIYRHTYYNSNKGREYKCCQCPFDASRFFFYS